MMFIDTKKTKNIKVLSVLTRTIFKLRNMIVYLTNAAGACLIIAEKLTLPILSSGQ